MASTYIKLGVRPRIAMPSCVCFKHLQYLQDFNKYLKSMVLHIHGSTFMSLNLFEEGLTPNLFISVDALYSSAFFAMLVTYVINLIYRLC